MVMKARVVWLGMRKLTPCPVCLTHLCRRSVPWCRRCSAALAADRAAQDEILRQLEERRAVPAGGAECPAGGAECPAGGATPE